jgi:FkbM family methyltransferase
MNLKRTINSVLGRFGYRIQRIGPGATSLGIDPFRDMRKLSVAGDRPLVFDVGANIGQSIENFRHYFACPAIHSFEPSPQAFLELRRRTMDVPDLALSNVALGARSGQHVFFESAAGSPMSSLLPPGSECWGGGGIRDTLQVNLGTIDEYCAQHEIERIDILKIDTQGYDLEVIKGASAMLQMHSIHLIHMEIIFGDMYQGIPRMDEVYAYLADRGLVLVTFYPFYYWGEKASWTEALFMDPEFRRAD